MAPRARIFIESLCFNGRSLMAATVTVMPSMAVAIVAAVVELAADLARPELRRVHVGVGLAGADEGDDFLELTRCGGRCAHDAVGGAVCTSAAVRVPLTLPLRKSLGLFEVHSGVLSKGDWNGATAESHSQRTMPPEFCGSPMWMCACVTSPSNSLNVSS